MDVCEQITKYVEKPKITYQINKGIFFYIPKLNEVILFINYF